MWNMELPPGYGSSSGFTDTSVAGLRRAVDHFDEKLHTVEDIPVFGHALAELINTPLRYFHAGVQAAETVLDLVSQDTDPILGGFMQFADPFGQLHASVHARLPPQEIVAPIWDDIDASIARITQEYLDDHQETIGTERIKQRQQVVRHRRMAHSAHNNHSSRLPNTRRSRYQKKPVRHLLDHGRDNAGPYRPNNNHIRRKIQRLNTLVPQYRERVLTRPRTTHVSLDSLESQLRDQQAENTPITNLPFDYTHDTAPTFNTPIGSLHYGSVQPQAMGPPQMPISQNGLL